MAADKELSVHTRWACPCVSLDRRHFTSHLPDRTYTGFLMFTVKLSTRKGRENLNWIINVSSIQIYEFFSSWGALQMHACQLAESSALFVGCLTCTQSPSRASNSAHPLFFCTNSVHFLCHFQNIPCNFAVTVRNWITFSVSYFGPSVCCLLHFAFDGKLNLKHLCFSCSQGEVPQCCCWHSVLVLNITLHP